LRKQNEEASCVIGCFLICDIIDIANGSNNILFYLFADDITVFINGVRNQTIFDNMNCELDYLSNTLMLHANVPSFKPNKTTILLLLALETNSQPTLIKL